MSFWLYGQEKLTNTAAADSPLRSSRLTVLCPAASGSSNSGAGVPRESREDPSSTTRSSSED